MLICFFLQVEIKKKLFVRLWFVMHEHRRITNESLNREINFDEFRPAFTFSERDR